MTVMAPTLMGIFKEVPLTGLHKREGEMEAGHCYTGYLSKSATEQQLNIYITHTFILPL